MLSVNKQVRACFKHVFREERYTTLFEITLWVGSLAICKTAESRRNAVRFLFYDGVVVLQEGDVVWNSVADREFRRKTNSSIQSDSVGNIPGSSANGNLADYWSNLSHPKSVFK